MLPQENQDAGDRDVSQTIASLAALEALYGEINPISLRKELAQLTPEYQQMLEASSFVAVATCGVGGLDCSPRGDPAGFLRVMDPRTLAFADRRGNNRLDTLRNLIVDPRLALLCLIPGINETLRVNGRAVLSVEPALLETFTIHGKPPKCVVVMSIESVYFQCARALIRSKLWDPAQHRARGALPSAGAMTEAADKSFDGAGYDAALPDRQQATLY